MAADEEAERELPAAMAIELRLPEAALALVTAAPTDVERLEKALPAATLADPPAAQW